MEYYSAIKRNAFESVLMRWMNIKPIIQSAVKSERERQKSYISAYIWNLERWYQWSYVQGSKGDTDIKNRLSDTVGEGEGGMIWENSMETYTLPYVKYVASGSLMYNAGNPNLVLCDNLEGWRKEGCGRGIQEGGVHMYVYGWFMLMYGKNHHNIVISL